MYLMNDIYISSFIPDDLLFHSPERCHCSCNKAHDDQVYKNKDKKKRIIINVEIIDRG
jgi:hypothetical protein